jgi:hypothetical protein
MKRAALITVLAIAGAVAVAGCGTITAAPYQTPSAKAHQQAYSVAPPPTTSQSATTSQDCIVLAWNGNKICGATEAAWCLWTDPARATAIGEGGPYATFLQQTRQACKQAEADYPTAP